MRKAIEAGNTYTVYVGGTDTKKTNVATISAVAEKFDVKFVNWNDTEISSTSLEEGAKITPPATNPTKASDSENDYTFAGWYLSTDAEQKLVTFDDNTKVTGAVTYKAKFTSIPKSQGGEATQYDFTVNSGLKDDAATKPYGIENGKIIRVSGLKETDVVTVTVDGEDYTAKYYKTPDNEIVHIVALVTDEEITNDMISHTTGTPELMIFGDVDGTVGIASTDPTILKSSVLKAPKRNGSYSLPTSISDLIIFDVDGNGEVVALDATILKSSLLKAPKRNGSYSLETMGSYTIK